MDELWQWILTNPEEAGAFLALLAFAFYQTFQALINGKASDLQTEIGENFQTFKSTCKRVKESPGYPILKRVITALVFRKIDSTLKKRGWLGASRKDK